MAIPLVKVLSYSENGLLAVFYNKGSENPKIEKFSLTKEGKVKDFVLKKIWVNQQPAHSLKGFKFKQLTYNNLDHYDVIEDELYLFLNSQKEISIKIGYKKNEEFQEITLNISPHLKVSGMKKLLQKKLKIEKFEILKNKSTLYDKYQLKDCGVKENTQLMIEYKKDTTLVGASAFNFVDVTQRVSLSSEDFRIDSLLKNFCQLQISIAIRLLSYAILPIHMIIEPPPWKTLQGGLNFVGECQNIECEAYEKIVYSPKGYDTFHLGAEQGDACCPMPKCKKELINVNNCILLDCNYSIEGEYINKEKMPPIIDRAPKNQPFSFRENNIVKWNYLIIKTEQLPARFFNCTIL